MSSPNVVITPPVVAVTTTLSVNTVTPVPDDKTSVSNSSSSRSLLNHVNLRNPIPEVSNKSNRSLWFACILIVMSWIILYRDIFVVSWNAFAYMALGVSFLIFVIRYFNRTSSDAAPLYSSVGSIKHIPKFEFSLWNQRFHSARLQLNDLCMKPVCRGNDYTTIENIIKNDQQHKEKLKQQEATLKTTTTTPSVTTSIESSNNTSVTTTTQHDEILGMFSKGINVGDIFNMVQPARAFVFDCVDALNNTELATMIDLLLLVARPALDRVLIRITSGGGEVGAFGLAAAQLLRLRSVNIHTVALIDTMALSGGFMIAAACTEIIAAPFASVGSIGVVVEFANFAKILNKLNVDYHTITAGAYKRTVSEFGPISKEGMLQFRASLVDVHQAFQAHIKDARGSKLRVKMPKIADGRSWRAAQAIDFGMVDRLATSDAVLQELCSTHLVIHIEQSEAEKSKSTWVKIFKELVSAHDLGLKLKSCYHWCIQQCNTITYSL